VQHETELLEDSLAVPGFPLSSKFDSSEDEFVDSDDHANSQCFHLSFLEYEKCC